MCHYPDPVTTGLACTLVPLDDIRRILTGVLAYAFRYTCAHNRYSVVASCGQLTVRKLQRPSSADGSSFV